MSFPGWDSIETTSKLYKLFTGLALISLGLVAVFDVLAWIYSNRKDSLIETAQQKRTEQDQAKESDLNARLSATEKAAREAKEGQASAEGELSKLRANAVPRKLDNPRRDRLIHDLTQHPGHIAFIGAVMDGEAGELAAQVRDVFLAANWNINTFAASIPGETSRGIVYSIPNPQHPSAEEQALIAAFAKAGIPVTVQAGNNSLIVGFRVPQ